MKKITYFLFLGLTSLPLHANELPIATICDMKTFYSPDAGSPIVTVAFDASCTSDVDSPEVWDRETGKHVRYEGMTYRWIFPAGVISGVISGPVVIDEQKPVVKFVRPGVHYVTLWVKDKDGGDAKTGIKILISHVPKVAAPPGPSPVGNFPPTADAGGPYVAGIVFEGRSQYKTGDYSEIQFVANATDFDEQMFGNAQYLQYGWNFGNGCKYRQVEKSPFDVWGNQINYPDGMIIFYDGDGSVGAGVDQGSGRFTYDVKPGNTCRSTGKNPTHVFTKPGTYNVELLVVDKYYPSGEWGNNYNTYVPPGSTKAYTTVFVNQIPVIYGIQALQPGVLFPRTKIQFESNGGDFDDHDLKLFWDFGDGHTATHNKDENPTHVYDNPGNYVVSVVASDGYHASDVFSYPIEISSSPNRAPVADFALPSGTWTMRPHLRFESSSYDPDGHDVTDESWDFGDGHTAKGERSSHQYDKAGKYVVTLTVTDGYDTSTVSKTIDITSSTNYYAPQANFYISHGSTGGKTTFNNLSYDFDRHGNPLRGKTIRNSLSTRWDFGDGNTSTEIRPQHIYTAPGKYLVTLTVSDGDYSSVLSKSIEVVTKNKKKRPPEPPATPPSPPAPPASGPWTGKPKRVGR